MVEITLILNGGGEVSRFVTEDTHRQLKALYWVHNTEPFKYQTYKSTDPDDEYSCCIIVPSRITHYEYRVL